MGYDLLVSAKEAQKHPYKVFLLALLVGTIATLIGSFVFDFRSSLIVILFSIIPFVPIMTKILEEEELLFAKKQFRHHKVIAVYSALFLGLIVSYSFWYVALPHDRTDIFDEQVDALYEYSGIYATYSEDLLQVCTSQYGVPDALGSHAITNCRLGDVSKDGHREIFFYEEYTNRPTVVYETRTGNVQPYFEYVTKTIVTNNLIVLFLTYLTSIVFGAGALYLIIWNASVIAVFVGEFARTLFAKMQVGIVEGYLLALPGSLISIALHGIPEILAYFIGALAGGILSVAMLRHKPFSKEFNTVAKDSAVLLGIAAICVLLAGVVEAI